MDLTVTLERPLDERFDSIKSEWSFFMATKTTTPPVAVAGPDFILTWHILHLERTLSAPAGSQRVCGVDLPKVVELEPGEIAGPLLGGAATVEGVVVTMTSGNPQASFEVGRRYLFIGAVSPDRTALLPYGDSSVIPLASEGTIGPSRAPYPFSFVGDIVGFKHLAELERRLREHRSAVCRSPTACIRAVGDTVDQEPRTETTNTHPTSPAHDRHGAIVSTGA